MNHLAFYWGSDSFILSEARVVKELSGVKAAIKKTAKDIGVDLSVCKLKIEQCYGLKCGCGYYGTIKIGEFEKAVINKAKELGAKKAQGEGAGNEPA